ncbi:alpha/beta hydrolase [Marinomonas sp. C2222]|uniref:Alpha/beta hydrolase n=1 Tax=Marinomonas sargassi TaxID=2984494 RepID=A0ABT2YP10_9GAMM|nr:alpha/beta hydrolase [Marinomonas sargassi]MCV2401621.1 alpha/beta hydrolase [Marinomonas sargassi]
MQDWVLESEKEDHLGDSFVARTFKQPSPVIHTTLIHHIANPNADKAILYIHGYTDYFFQAGLAEYFISLGYRFYAIDLRGYGRSIRPYRPPTWCESISEYIDDLDLALATIKQDGIAETIVLAHSTGALISANYLAKKQQAPSLDNDDKQTLSTVTGLIFNSPFLALPFSPQQIKWLKKPVKAIVSSFPSGVIKTNKPIVYAKSLHSQFEGEWDYRLDWKPENGFGLSLHWLNEIIRAQEWLATQTLNIPTLLCRSEVSTISKKSVGDMQQGDGVLHVESMEEAVKNTFDNLTIKVIPKGFHDLYLSKEPAQQAYLQTMSDWLTEQD